MCVHMYGYHSNYNIVKINIQSSFLASLQYSFAYIMLLFSMLMFLLTHIKREFINMGIFSNYSKMSLLEKGRTYQEEGRRSIAAFLQVGSVLFAGFKLNSLQRRKYPAQYKLFCAAEPVPSWLNIQK